MRAIYVSVTAGNAPYISWTVAVEFIQKTNHVKMSHRKSLLYDIFEYPEPIAMNKVTNADIKILQQIVPPGTPHSVTTLNRQDFKLAFCPDAGTTQRLGIYFNLLMKEHMTHEGLNTGMFKHKETRNKFTFARLIKKYLLASCFKKIRLPNPFEIRRIVTVKKNR